MAVDQQHDHHITMGDTANPAVSLRSVSKRFGEVLAVDDVSLDLADRELLAIIGPSGCGKSTLLAMIANLLSPDSGTIRLHGTAQSAGSPRGQVALMPQRDALLPWRSVLDNAILGLEVHGVPRREARERARTLLPRFGLEAFADALPETLSGGMRQRAAFLRTVLTERSILLLDEPFGALDAITRRALHGWLLDLWDDLGRSILLVTHDVEEALLLADRVAVMSPRPGSIVLEERVLLPRPRTTAMVSEPAFVAQKARLLDALLGPVAAQWGQVPHA